MRRQDSTKSLSTDAVNIVIDVSAKNSVPRPIDPNDPDLPRLREIKRLLDQERRKKRRRPGGGSNE